MYGTLTVISRKTGIADTRQYPIDDLTVTLGRKPLTSDIRLYRREIRDLHFKIFVQQKNPQDKYDGYQFNLRSCKCFLCVFLICPCNLLIDNCILL